MGKLPLGVILALKDDPLASLEQVQAFGLPTCQILPPSEAYLNGKKIPALLKAVEKTGVSISTVTIGFEGQVWDFIKGPATIGFVPPATRAERVALSKRISDFSKEIGVDQVTGHVGFIPENPEDPNYKDVVETLKEWVGYCGDNGQYFCFETGQETPVTLKRAIEDVGADNIGINFDPANLVMYGKANALDALEILGPYVRGVHCKDGHYPTNPRQLGEEVPLGEGRTNFPELIRRLVTLGYDRPLTIEREVSGERQKKDIAHAIKVLEQILSSL
jgi:L-ribulose-5-phosphate 3-epimerase